MSSSPQAPGLPPSPVPVHAGKVRALYPAGPDRLVMVASDRISAFDVVLAEPIPDKGRVLTATTAYWFEALATEVPGTFLTADPLEIAHALPGAASLGDIAGRAMLVRRAQMIPLECIVRGYLAGQAYSEYEESGTVHGTPLPPGLRRCDRLPEPMFTPSTKAAQGHDQNISFSEATQIVGADIAETVRELSLTIYRRAAARAEEVGLVLADTKFEFGIVEGAVALCDEVVTPDSSRIWPADQVVVGEVPPSLDKQPVRDWLADSGWDRTPPPPALPPEVVTETSRRYVTAYERLSGRALSQWYGARP